MGSPCSAGHRQKLEDQTKPFPDRFGDLERLRMRVTPSTPSPRGSISTTSHYSSQAQTPIQGTAQGEPGGGGDGGGGPGHGPASPEQRLLWRSFTALPCFMKEDSPAHGILQMTSRDTLPRPGIGPSFSHSATTYGHPLHATRSASPQGPARIDTDPASGSSPSPE